MTTIIEDIAVCKGSRHGGVIGTDAGCVLTSVPERTVELIAVARLKPYRGNARTHSKKQIAQIADSIRRFGFTNPVLIDDAGQLIAGHGRVAAAKLLGLSAVPALRLSHLSEAEKRAYVLADNRLAQKAGWNREILAIELQGLVDLDFDVALTGFSVGQIAVVLGGDSAGKAAAEATADSLPDRPGPAVSRAGDVWLMGKHCLVCGDTGGDGADVVVEHWQSYTGESATLASTGESFAQVRQARLQAESGNQGLAEVRRRADV